MLAMAAAVVREELAAGGCRPREAGLWMMRTAVGNDERLGILAGGAISQAVSGDHEQISNNYVEKEPPCFCNTR
jgi:hypothetical protein